MASKLQDLINRLCPNGVEYRKLGEVCDVCRGVRVVKSQLSETGKYAVYQNSLKPLGYHSEANCSGGTAFVIGAGAAGEVGYCAEEFWAADDCYYLNGKGKVVGRFLYYVLTSNQGYLASRVRKASIPRLARGFVEDLIIPVPSLEVQSEIVQILDNFAELTAELTAELEKRKKQYKHYRDLLLRPNKEAQWLTVGEVCDVVTDFTAAGSFADIAKNVVYKKEPDFAQLVRTTDIKSHFSKKEQVYINESAFKYLWRVRLDEDSIILPNIGNCGEVYYLRPDDLPYRNCALAPNALLLRSGKANLRYLSYWFMSEDFQRRLRKIVSPTGQTKFNKTDLKKLPIPLPPLAEQRRIVSILDRFDRLCNDLTSGLPAEIAARKKQYAYYRDKLLELRVGS